MARASASGLAPAERNATASKAHCDRLGLRGARREGPRGLFEQVVGRPETRCTIRSNGPTSAACVATACAASVIPSGPGDGMERRLAHPLSAAS